MELRASFREKIVIRALHGVTLKDRGGSANPEDLDAPDDDDDSPACLGSGLSAAQAPRPLPELRFELRQGPRLLSRSRSRALFGLHAPRRGPGWMVRGKNAGAGFMLAQYVNDRPYAASS